MDEVSNDEKEFEVEDIINDRKRLKFDEAKDKYIYIKEYFIKWVGYKKKTWEPEENLKHCSTILEKYLQRKRNGIKENQKKNKIFLNSELKKNKERIFYIYKIKAKRTKREIREKRERSSSTNSETSINNNINNCFYQKNNISSYTIYRIEDISKEKKFINKVKYNNFGPSFEDVINIDSRITKRERKRGKIEGVLSKMQKKKNSFYIYSNDNSCNNKINNYEGNYFNNKLNFKLYTNKDNQ